MADLPGVCLGHAPTGLEALGPSELLETAVDLIAEACHSILLAPVEVPLVPRMNGHGRGDRVPVDLNVRVGVGVVAAECPFPVRCLRIISGRAETGPGSVEGDAGLAGQSRLVRCRQSPIKLSVDVVTDPRVLLVRSLVIDSHGRAGVVAEMRVAPRCVGHTSGIDAAEAALSRLPEEIIFGVSLPLL